MSKSNEKITKLVLAIDHSSSSISLARGKSSLLSTYILAVAQFTLPQSGNYHCSLVVDAMAMPVSIEVTICYLAGVSCLQAPGHVALRVREEGKRSRHRFLSGLGLQ